MQAFVLPEAPTAAGWLAFDAAPIAMSFATTDMRLVRVNRAFGELMGVDPADAPGLDGIELISPGSRAPALERVAALVEAGHGGYTVEQQFGPDGSRWLHAEIALAGGPEGEHWLICCLEDATERRRELEQLERLADRDPLTGLLNRRRMEEELERHLAEARRHGRHGALVVLDVDHFKAVNDHHGHEGGDRVLAYVAAAIRERARDEDAVARLGGDEFAVLLRESGTEDAERIACELVALIGESRVVGEHAVTLSAGVTAVDAGVASARDALRAADIAMYAAKTSGRDRVVVERAGAAEPTAPGRSMLDALRDVAEGPSIDGVLTAVRELLGMDLAYITHHTPTEQVFVTVDGDADSFGVAVGARLPLEQTYCHHILEGDLPHVIPDLLAEPIAAGLPVTEAAGVRSYCSVPVRLSDGTLYGTLCAADHAVQMRLGERDRQFLDVLARMVAGEVERDAQLRTELRLRAQAVSAEALLSAVEARDHYTGSHSRSVVDLAAAVARELGMADEQVHEASQVALLHDVGKLAVPDAILGKRGPLTPEEMAVMRRHPVDGARIVAAIPDLGHLARAVRAEHERWDGGGYPDGLAGEAIPPASRIAFVCDAWHAMTSDRPYRAALSREDALREIAENAGTQFCPMATRALLAVLTRR